MLRVDLDCRIDRRVWGRRNRPSNWRDRCQQLQRTHLGFAQFL